MKPTTVIVGANLAGGRAAAGLRSHGYDGDIVLLGAEPVRPYQRPPLSKEVLWDEKKTLDLISLHPAGFYAENRIDLRLGTRVTRLDLARRRVVTEAGEEIPADTVLLATGGRPRRLNVAGADLDGVLYLRSHDHAMDLRGRLRPGTRVVVVGMGVIGAEVAASTVKLGCEVTAIEAAPLPMSRIFGTQASRWLCDKHTRMGVRVLLQTGVNRFVGENGRLTAVETSSGEQIPADVALIGIGIDVATELAAEAGIATLPHGIPVDRQCRSSVAEVFAAGDVTAQSCFFSANPVRIETFQNASEQGTTAAAAIAGKTIEYWRPVWFWTDQFDLKVQGTGRVDDRFTQVLRGDLDAEKFLLFFLNDGVLEGAVSVNNNPEMAVARRLIEKRMTIPAAVLADTQTPLKELLTRAPAA